jgi:hypothetical protein
VTATENTNGLAVKQQPVKGDSMKLVSFVLPALLVGSFAFAQGGAGAPPPSEAPAAAEAPAHKTAKQAKADCKAQAAGDKKAYKACLKDWKKSQK